VSVAASLRQHHRLQLRPLGRQRQLVVSIPPILRPPQIPDHSMVHDGIYHGGRRSPDPHIMLLLSPRGLFLGQDSGRILHHKAASLVHYGWVPTIHRLCDPSTSNSGFAGFATPEEAKDQFSARFHAGRIVRLYYSRSQTASANSSLSGCIVSILRLHGLYAVTISTDVTYDNSPAVTWSSVELNVGIMCACVPALRPVISAVFPKLLSTTQRGGTASNPFQASSHSRAYYQRNDSTIELSRSGVERQESDHISFDTATKEAQIHVTQEWSIDERKSEVPSSTAVGSAM
jgi:hypothetical protein